MQRASHDRYTKRPQSPHRKWVIGAVLLMAALVAGGVGATAVQGQRAASATSQARADYVPPTTYTPPPDNTEVAFLGDSYTAGTGASSKFKRWSSLVAQEMRWVELNYARGGTNYATADALRGGTPYHERLTDLILSQPDIIIVTSAGNSLSTDQTEGIHKTFDILREEVPDAHIFAVSPFYWASELPNSYKSFGKDVKKGVEAVDGTYLEIGHPLGNKQEAIYEDGTHPNDAGHKILANVVVDALREADVSEVLSRS